MRTFNQVGMTLIELSVVLLILIALAGLALPYVSGISQLALCQATDATMQNIKKSIMGGGLQAGFYIDNLGRFPKTTDDTATNDYNLKYLFTKPAVWSVYSARSGTGWNGPYLQGGIITNTSTLSNHFTDKTQGYVHENITSSDHLILDGWGRPIVIQFDAGYGARLVSAGRGSGVGFSKGELDILTSTASQSGTDDRILNLTKGTQANTDCNDI